jgi:hypothetical protein
MPTAFAIATFDKFVLFRAKTWVFTAAEACFLPITEQAGSKKF